ncbi:hypothetical protein [Kitasatospora sp. CB02891]|uniref:hypothetical protein n=1 Tax=Kitasatospora sp. CB02891 TaxID=2020329 RepID=UPI000C27FA5F|nr:hypothetical protein [Kitasatospora sp. CB02891]PJN22417.1 hypothetical protein CG736_28300 [Kitasatospora sp. CB02891]
MHDRVAELRGLRNEYARHSQYDRPERAAQASAQAERVAAEIEADIEHLEDRAAELAERGQDIPAGEAAAAARTLRAALDELTADPAPQAAAPASRAAGKGGKQAPAAAKPPENTGS